MPKTQLGPSDHVPSPFPPPPELPPHSAYSKSSPAVNANSSSRPPDYAQVDPSTTAPTPALPRPQSLDANLEAPLNFKINFQTVFPSMHFLFLFLSPITYRTPTHSSVLRRLWLSHSELISCRFHRLAIRLIHLLIMISNLLNH